MAKRAIIRLGDRTTHGGTVVTAHPTFDVNGKKIARVGDKVDCPKCNGTFPITTGAPHALSNRNIARHDDTTSCGAKLIASQGTATIDDTGGSADSSVPAAVTAAAIVAGVSIASAASPAAPVSPPVSRPVAEAHAIRFRALDPDTGAPLPECIYTLTRENGARHGGVTDAEGFTEIIETTQPENVGIHFMFKSPLGDPIERENLTT